MKRCLYFLRLALSWLDPSARSYRLALWLLNRWVRRQSQVEALIDTSRTRVAGISDIDILVIANSRGWGGIARFHRSLRTVLPIFHDLTCLEAQDLQSWLAARPDLEPGRWKILSGSVTFDPIVRPDRELDRALRFKAAWHYYLRYALPALSAPEPRWNYLDLLRVENKIRRLFELPALEQTLLIPRLSDCQAVVGRIYATLDRWAVDLPDLPCYGPAGAAAACKCYVEVSRRSPGWMLSPLPWLERYDFALSEKNLADKLKASTRRDLIRKQSEDSRSLGKYLNRIEAYLGRRSGVKGWLARARAIRNDLGQTEPLPAIRQVLAFYREVRAQMPPGQ